MTAVVVVPMRAGRACNHGRPSIRTSMCWSHRQHYNRPMTVDSNNWHHSTRPSAPSWNRFGLDPPQWHRTHLEPKRSRRQQMQLAPPYCRERPQRRDDQLTLIRSTAIATRSARSLTSTPRRDGRSTRILMRRTALSRSHRSLVRLHLDLRDECQWRIARARVRMGCALNRRRTIGRDDVAANERE